MKIKPSDIVRFFQKVGTTTLCDCWLWDAATDDNGYGRFRLGKRVLGAHVVSYMIFNGLDKPDDTVHHKDICLRRNCVNPQHLELLTLTDNTRDANERHIAGEDIWICPRCGGGVLPSRECRNCGEVWPQKTFLALVKDEVPF